MHPFVILFHLAAAVMLLLWAVRMVRTGVERAHGPALKTILRSARGGQPGMAAVGMGLAVVLQSSTAVGLLAAGFAASGILGIAAGLAAMIGADLGSALVVKVLSYDLSELIPLLILAGTVLFLKFEDRALRQWGRILMGVAFILMSLGMISAATEPLRESRLLPMIAGYLAGDPLTAFAVAALLAWAVHSSVATVLILVSFAGSGLLPMEAALPMVLGANLGGGLVGVWLTRDMPLPARRIPLGNLIVRGAGAALALLAVVVLPLPLDRIGAGAGQQLVNFHVLFNMVLVLLALPLVGAVDRLTARLWPEPAVQDMAKPFLSALDKGAAATPALALASAKRELLRMGETVEVMFRPVMDLIDGGDKAAIARIRATDDDLNRRHTDIKMFVAGMNRGTVSHEEARRGLELSSTATDFEYIGDLVAKTLLTLAEEKSRKRLRFSSEGWLEMNRLHARVEANLQLAMNVLVSGDLASARTLAAEKEVMRRLERDSHDRHLSRLQSGQVESIETSDIHLEIVRALKEINSLLVKTAYPILKESGHLLDSRLAPADKETV
ncbi:MAG: Na/Pi cotransporter family protein [Pseudorhodobacter sp.]